MALRRLLRPVPEEKIIDSPKQAQLEPDLKVHGRVVSSPSNTRRNGDVLPRELQNAVLSEQATLESCPTHEDMTRWLEERGVQTSDWGQENSKTVKKLWEEVRDNEAGLECRVNSDGTKIIVRVAHVLRAKVCSEESRLRDVFLFNTWQQFEDGRKRTRNGLLSEKLSTNEMPLEDHLHEVCVRAVTVEEMQRVEQSNFSVRPGVETPSYNPHYICPLKVVDEHFVDHTVEMEVSRSYPRLLTMYHLYTVDIVCTGLPTVDFNTLEFEPPKGLAKRKLKYVHAWVWLTWSEIRRYLFEGSELKERKKEGSFEDAEDLENWLSQFEKFDLDLSSWGKGNLKSVEDLWKELESQEAHLEHWGRHDGVPLLMRVLHVMQLKVISPEPSMKGKFLIKTWEMRPDGAQDPVHRLLSKKISTKYLPFDDKVGGPFHNTAIAAVQKELRYLVDSFFQLRSDSKVRIEDVEASSVKVNSVKFVDQHHDLEDSQSFKGMHTMYHLYTVEVECSELPLTNFASIEFRSHQLARVNSVHSSVSHKEEGMEAISLNGWRWASWEEALDLMHKYQRRAQQQCSELRNKGEVDRVALEVSEKKLNTLAERIEALDKLSKTGALGKDNKDAIAMIESLKNNIGNLKSVCNSGLRLQRRRISGSEVLPPTMVHQLTKDTEISHASSLPDTNQFPVREESRPVGGVVVNKPKLASAERSGPDREGRAGLLDRSEHLPKMPLFFNEVEGDDVQIDDHCASPPRKAPLPCVWCL